MTSRSAVAACALVLFALLWSVYFRIGMSWSAVGALFHFDALFQADPPRVVRDIAGATPFALRAGPHPLFPLLLHPLGSLLATWTGSMYSAAVAATAFAGALAVAVSMILFARVGMPLRTNVLFSALIGVSASHVVFASLPDTFMFSAVLTLAAVLLVLSRRSSIGWFVAAGVLAFGVTITNIAVIAVLLCAHLKLRSQPMRKPVLVLGASVLLIGTGLAVFQQRLYPGSRSFYKAESYGGILRYRAALRGMRAITRGVELAKHAFLYSLIAPAITTQENQRRVEVAGSMMPLPRISCGDFCRWVQRFDGRTPEFDRHLPELSFHSDSVLPGYRPAVWPGVLLWTALLGLAGYKLASGFRKLPVLEKGLLAVLAFHWGLHFVYGDDLFLFSAHWTAILVVLTALLLRQYWTSRWFQAALLSLVLFCVAHNGLFVQRVLRIFGGDMGASGM